MEDANSLPEIPAAGQISILDFPSPLWKVRRVRTPCTVCGEITLALSQHRSQNGPIKQMAPDPTPGGGDINTESRVIDHASHSQHRAGKKNNNEAETTKKTVEWAGN